MVAGSDSCEVTRYTVQIVDGCPDSKEKWKEAVARKNCSAYANQCDEPNKLVYHCVINEYVTQTLEVCAYAQNIVLGRLLFDCYFNKVTTLFDFLNQFMQRLVFIILSSEILRLFSNNFNLAKR